MDLTSSQQRAIGLFKSFLGGDSQVFILKGAAGTGKTTLVSKFISVLEAQHRDVRLMAPTGRAAYIISKKTMKTASTIHRGIYSLTKLNSAGPETNENEDENFHLRFGLKPNEDSRSALYIVDEASMVSNVFSENETFSFGTGCLLADLFEYVNGRKIVFIGDYAQLPPVGMSSSPALDKEYIEKTFGCNVVEAFLDEVMRQSDNGVMLQNATRIRNCIEDKSFIEFKLDDGMDSVAEDVDLLQPYYQLSSDNPSVRAAIITYSNKQALDYNLRVRQHYYGADAPRLKRGDLLMVSRNNYAYDYEMFNGNIVQVEACQSDNELVCRNVRVKMGKDRIETVELKFRKATIRFAANGNPVSLNVTLLDNFLDNPSGAVDGVLARALIVDFNNRLPKNIISRRNEIRRLLKAKSKLTLDQELLIKSYVNLLQSDPFYNALICKYGYAMTCHKAQGGEWDNVFVDMCRFGGTANEDYFRWAYTALTRAGKKIWHYRSPEFNYISKLVVEEITPSPNIKVSNYDCGSDFREARFQRIKEKAGTSGLIATDDLSKQYQHLITFTDGKSERATFRLWYKAKGYNAGKELVVSTNDEFSALCDSILEASHAPVFVPFSAPERPFAEKLVEFVRSQLDELGIQLLDITNQNYQDVFHLKTDGIAQIVFSYTAKGNYTYMRLLSTLGPLDTKLQALRKRFI